MLHSNNLDKGHQWGYWYIYFYDDTFLSCNHLLNTCLSLLDVLSTEKFMKQNKMASEFLRTNSCHIRQAYLSDFILWFSQGSNGECCG